MKVFWAAMLMLTMFLVSKPLYPQAGLSTASAPPVSILQLMATPENFDGKTVSVIGYFYLGRDEALLYLQQEDYNHALTANAIWFQPGIWAKDVGKMQRKYVSMVGTFSAARKGPSGCPNGGLAVVDSLSVWSSPDNPAGLLRHPN